MNTSSETFVINKADLTVVGKIADSANHEPTDSEVLVDNFEQIQSQLSGPQMVTIYNGLVENPIKKFDTKSKGAARLMKALEQSTAIKVIDLTENEKAPKYTWTDSYFSITEKRVNEIQDIVLDNNGTSHLVSRSDVDGELFTAKIKFFAHDTESAWKIHAAIEGIDSSSINDAQEFYSDHGWNVFDKTKKSESKNDKQTVKVKAAKQAAKQAQVKKVEDEQRKNSALLHITSHDAYETFMKKRHPKNQIKDVIVAAAIIAKAGENITATELSEISGFPPLSSSPSLVVCISSGIRTPYTLEGIATVKNKDKSAEKAWTFDPTHSRMKGHPQFKDNMTKLRKAMENYIAWIDADGEGSFVSWWMQKSGMPENLLQELGNARKQVCEQALKVMEENDF